MSKEKDLFAELTRLSFENAKQWLKDAKLLIENSSYGHAYAALVFTIEETMKAWTCWLVSEGMITKDSEDVKDAFKNHLRKQEVFFWVLYGMLFWKEVSKNPELFKEQSEKYLKLKPEEKKESLMEGFEEFDKIVESIENARQKCIYVDCLKEEGKTHSPQYIKQEIVERFLNIVEQVLCRVIESTESKFSKEFLRRFYESIPEELKTDKISFAWFNDTEKME